MICCYTHCVRSLFAGEDLTSVSHRSALCIQQLVSFSWCIISFTSRFTNGHGYTKITSTYLLQRLIYMRMPSIYINNMLYSTWEWLCTESLCNYLGKMIMLSSLLTSFIRLEKSQTILNFCLMSSWTKYVYISGSEITQHNHEASWGTPTSHRVAKRILATMHCLFV